MRTKNKISKGDIVRFISWGLILIYLIAHFFWANYTKNNPITPPGGKTLNTAISISTDTEIEVEIYYYTVFGVNKDAHYNWNDGEKYNLSKNRYKINETLKIPNDFGVHKLTVVYGDNEYVYYYNVEES